MKADGCTDFSNPISKSVDIIKSVSKNGNPWNFIFMSDGYHNGCKWEDVISKVTDLAGIECISSSYIIEYGYYANSDALNEMASIMGSNKIFDRSFDELSSDLIHSVEFSGRAPRKLVEIGPLMARMARSKVMFSVSDGVVNLYDAADEFYVNENVDKIYFISKSKDHDDKINVKSSVIWSAVYALASVGDFKYVEEILYALSDRTMIDMYQGALGKQKIEEFKKSLLEKVAKTSALTYHRSSLRYSPNPKKYCVLDFLNDITSTDGNRIIVTSPGFNYSPTGPKSVAKVVLTDDQKKKLSEAPTKAKAEKILSDASKNQVEMRYDYDKDIESTKYLNVTDMVWNSTRANVSLQTSVPVILTVPKKDGKGTFEMNSHIIRNYTIIKDGILNVTEIPMVINNGQLRGKFKRMGMLSEIDKSRNVYMINISNLPIINRSRTKSVTSAELAQMELNLLNQRFIFKYLKYISPKSTTMISKVVNDPYLESLGITEKGYSPKTEQIRTDDFYYATSLDTKIEKFSTIPKIEVVLNKVKSGKSMTVSEEYMSKVIELVNEKLSYEGISAKSMMDELEIRKSKSIKEISELKFSLILSRGWFSDKEDMDDNIVKICINGNNLNMKFEYNDTKMPL